MEQIGKKSMMDDDVFFFIFVFFRKSLNKVHT